MAITNGYASLSMVKAAARITDAVDDALLELAIESSSRLIDGHCQRISTLAAAPKHGFTPPTIPMFVPLMT